MEEKKEEVKAEEKELKNTEENIPKRKLKKRFIIVSTVIVIAIIIAYILIRGSYLETMEIGETYLSVFWKNVRYKAIAWLINFVVIFVAIYINNKEIKKGLQEFFNQENKTMPKLVNKSVAFIISLVVSTLTSNYILEKAMLCFNSAEFGVQDPVFGIDIGYYVFKEPFIELVILYFLALFVGLLIYTAAYYIITFSVYFDGVDRKTLRNSKLIKQVTNTIMIAAILIAALVIVKAQNVGTQKFLNLQDEESTYSLYGAGVIDVTIKLWGYRLLAVVIVISVYMALKAFKSGKSKNVILDIMIVPAYLVILFLTMVLFQAIFVKTNEYDKEKKYIEYNIQYTKNAYGINIEEVNLNSTTENLTTQDLSNYADVINSTAIVNEDIVLKDLNNSQTAKGYYSFRDSQIGNYLINGKKQLVYVSPREIVNGSGTYNNKTYEYTHGYGAIITSATTTKENGTINHIQKGFKDSNEAITISEPRIYYGIQENDTVVTNTKGKTEFDYPILDSENADNAENSYDGKAGLSLDFFDRIILAIKEGDMKLAFSSNVTSESKILTNRNVIKRAQTIMPYLMYDEAPYLVVTEEGKLVWVLDAYTISNSYPYSQKTTIRQNSTTKFDINYIRNSVKVLIDAYDGTISFYITDRNDPIAMAYRNIYPDLFIDLDEEIPSDISSHFVYSEYLYNIQADVIARYHNIQPEVLYRSDDMWEIATYSSGKVLTKTGTKISPYYTMVKLQNEEQAILGLVLPYTPEGRQNIISYLVGSYDNSGNSKLTIYKYQANSSILGPMQLDTQIEQDSTVTKELEPLNVNGIKITKNILVVPLDASLLYIEPIYTQYINEDDALPTLKKVIVASGNKVAIGDTLSQALSNLVSQNAVNIEVESTDTIEETINTIIKANKNLTDSNSSNDWEMMGKDIQKLQELINKLEELVDEENKTKNEIKQSTTNEIDSNIITNQLENVIE